MLRSCLLKLRAPGAPWLARFASNKASEPYNTEDVNPPSESTFKPRFEKSVNQALLVGRVGSEPQLRGTEEHPVTVFTLATHTNYKHHTGELTQKTEWHRVSVFRPYLRDSVYKYMSKGQRVLVQGKIMYGQITDAGGTVHTTSTIAADDIIFFNKAGGSQQIEDYEDTFT